MTAKTVSNLRDLTGSDEGVVIYRNTKEAVICKWNKIGGLPRTGRLGQLVGCPAAIPVVKPQYDDISGFLGCVDVIYDDCQEEEMPSDGIVYELSDDVYVIVPAGWNYDPLSQEEKRIRRIKCLYEELVDLTKDMSLYGENCAAYVKIGVIQAENVNVANWLLEHMMDVTNKRTEISIFDTGEHQNRPWRSRSCYAGNDTMSRIYVTYPI